MVENNEMEGLIKISARCITTKRKNNIKTESVWPRVTSELLIT